MLNVTYKKCRYALTRIYSAKEHGLNNENLNKKIPKLCIGSSKERFKNHLMVQIYGKIVKLYKNIEANGTILPLLEFA